MLVPITVPNFDPLSCIVSPSRPTQGIVIARAATVDVQFPQFARWLLCGSPGAVSYIGWDGVTVVIPALASGVFHPIYAIQINSSGTTAGLFMWGN